MKLFKSTLFIVALCAIGTVSAKRRGAATPAKGRAATSAPQQVPASDVAERPFSYYFAEVRKMPANQVIGADGVFTDSFENFVKFSGLEPQFMRALLNAGRCLYLPLTGDNDQDIQTFIYAGERIDGVIASMRGAETGLGWEGTIIPDITQQAEQINANMNNINAKIKQLQDISAKSQIGRQAEEVTAKMNDVNQKIQQIKNISDVNQVEKQAAEVTAKMDDINKKIRQIQEKLTSVERMGVRGTPLSQGAVGGALEEKTMKDNVEDYVAAKIVDLQELLFTKENNKLKLDNDLNTQHALAGFAIEIANQYGWDLNNQTTRKNLVTIMLDKIVALFKNPKLNVEKPTLMGARLLGYKATLPTMVMNKLRSQFEQEYANKPLPAIPQ